MGIIVKKRVQSCPHLIAYNINVCCCSGKLKAANVLTVKVVELRHQMHLIENTTCSMKPEKLPYVAFYSASVIFWGQADRNS